MGSIILKNVLYFLGIHKDIHFKLKSQDTNLDFLIKLNYFFEDIWLIYKNITIQSKPKKNLNTLLQKPTS